MVKWVCRKGTLDELDREFDYEFWQSQSPTARLEAYWQMVVDYHLGILGEDEDKLRLDRSLVVLKQREG